MAAKTPAPSHPEGLRSRGVALWSSLGQEAGTPTGDLALEACRTADRLDELDAVIAGKGVLNLLMFRLKLDLADLVGDSDSDAEVRVKIEVSNVLAEARQQGGALRGLLAELGVSKPGKVEAPAAPPSPERSTGLDELGARRTQRG